MGKEGPFEKMAGNGGTEAEGGQFVGRDGT